MYLFCQQCLKFNNVQTATVTGFHLLSPCPKESETDKCSVCVVWKKAGSDVSQLSTFCSQTGSLLLNLKFRYAYVYRCSGSSLRKVSFVRVKVYQNPILHGLLYVLLDTGVIILTTTTSIFLELRNDYEV